MADPIKEVAGEIGFTLADVEGVLKQPQEVMREDILGPHQSGRIRDFSVSPGPP